MQHVIEQTTMGRVLMVRWDSGQVSAYPLTELIADIARHIGTLQEPDQEDIGGKLEAVVELLKSMDAEA
jgi:hypothetical protein